ncbi:LGFP repeat-containing protein [Saccharopolyspora erythraea NRRL 2338]|nr:LGFP repeat-containing protein [Saccharopolyspora erythraea NRRL 2338]
MKVRELLGCVAATATVVCLTTAVPAAAGIGATAATPSATEPAAPAEQPTGSAPDTSVPESPDSTTSPDAQTSSPAESPGDAAVVPADPAGEVADPGDGEIQKRYESMSEQQRQAVGEPAGAEVVEDEGLRWQDFTHGRFYWTPETGVKVVHGSIYGRLLELGGHAELGVPITDEMTSSGGGRYSDFRTRDGVIHSAIYWSTRTGAHLVQGRILEHFREIGEDAGFGYPSTDTRTTPDGFGAYNHFLTPSGQREDASIYWAQPTGPNAVMGAIRDKWAATGWERGPLSYPTTDELSTSDGVGRYNEFNGDGTLPAAIVWSPQTAAHSVQGVIAQRYAELGGPDEFLGYPTTDELPTPDGRGRFNHFTGTGGASIYWTPQTGAHAVYGGIRARWSQLGWERSYLGYPVGEEHDIPQGRAAEFEGGFIEWHSDLGQVIDYPKRR